MNIDFQRILNTLVPFVILGIATALIIGMFVVFSYLILWGLLIGVVFWIIAAVKAYLFPSATKVSIRGRIIEYTEKKRVKKN